MKATELRAAIAETWGKDSAHLKTFDILLQQSIRANNAIRGLEMTMNSIRTLQRGPDRFTLAKSTLEVLKGSP